MDLDAYQLEAGRTATRDMDAYPEVVRQAAACLDNAGRDGEELLKLFDQLIWCLGWAGEVGETLDMIKKHYGHGQPLDRLKLKKEFGDAKWYPANLERSFGFKSSEVAQTNIDKLRARHPNGFTVASAAAKADEQRIPDTCDCWVGTETCGRKNCTRPFASKLVERVTFGPVVNVDANGSPVSEDDLDGDVLG